MAFFKRKAAFEKEVEKAKDLLLCARRVYAYRCDVMKEKELQELRESQEGVKKLYSAKDGDESVLKKANNRLDAIMKKCGGKIYPVTFWSDNIETLLVAAILAIGIRTFFMQPFTIPTNSMYPTYNGMTSVTYIGEKVGVLKRIMRKVAFGASHYDIKAPMSGEVKIPLFSPEEGLGYFGSIRYRGVKGRKWFGLLPEKSREYTFYVGGEPVRFSVPLEFSIRKQFSVEDMVRQMYYADMQDFDQVLQEMGFSGNIESGPMGIVLNTGVHVNARESVLNFDILRGDMLLVNRFIYHFRKPKVGEPVIFRGENIKGMKDFQGNPVEKYFVKRLVGLGGDVLEVKPPALYRNGKPIEGAPAFEKNAEREGDYPGYTADKALELGRKERVLRGHFYGMGDNSPNSSDSRYWGPVPIKEVIGTPSLIFYPFTKRWGIAK